MLLLQHLDLVLLFLIFASLARIAATLYKGLGNLYDELFTAHEATEHSLEHVSSLYQALETVSGQEDKTQLAKLLAVYTARLCRVPGACFLDNTGNSQYNDDIPFLWLQDSESGSYHLSVDSKRLAWEQEMYRLGEKMRTVESVESIETYLAADGETLILSVPLRAHGDCFGFLACIQPAQEIRDADREKVLVFLAELGAIILARLETEKMAQRLLLSEEQNRIANEIHDGVSQYLFSITCALHGLSQQKTDLQSEKVQKQINLLKATATRAAAELRSAIYKISPQRQEGSVFLSNLSSYMDDLAKLNGIKTTLKAEGSEEVLSSALRKGLYRIIREAATNAIRHGKCGLLAVRLQMQPGSSVLEIEDDGCGYQPELIIKEKAGLGLHNIRDLTEKFNGELEIQSTPDQGTLIRCTIPKKSASQEAS